MLRRAMPVHRSSMVMTALPQQHKSTAQIAKTAPRIGHLGEHPLLPALKVTRK
jgi:hypothetical protein